VRVSMGITYSSWIRVGFSFEIEEINNTFKVITAPEKITYQDRFSPATGAKLKSKKIVTPERWEIRIQDEVIEDNYDDDGYFKRIAEIVGCEYDIYGDCGYSHIALYLPVKTVGELGLDSYKCTVGNSLDYGDACAKAKELSTLKSKLQQLGLEPGEPEIISCWFEG